MAGLGFSPGAIQAQVDAQQAALGNPTAGQVAATAGSSGATPVGSIPSQLLSTATGKSIGNTQLTSGWWITIGCVSGVVLANVPYIGPIVLGILGLSLIYQISQLVQGK